MERTGYHHPKYYCRFHGEGVVIIVHWRLSYTREEVVEKVIRYVKTYSLVAEDVGILFQYIQPGAPEPVATDFLPTLEKQLQSRLGLHAVSGLQLPPVSVPVESASKLTRIWELRDPVYGNFHWDFPCNQGFQIFGEVCITGTFDRVVPPSDFVCKIEEDYRNIGLEAERKTRTMLSWNYDIGNMTMHTPDQSHRSITQIPTILSDQPVLSLKKDP